MYPSDVILPANAKYYGFIDNKLPYNSHWDITWSFSFALTGSEHGFTTFLTTQPTLTGGIPGTRLGYLGDKEYLKDENGNILLAETRERLVADPSALSSYDTMGVLAIAFDTTGLFALSSATYNGVGLSQIKRNSLIIRDSNDDLVYNTQLSSLDTTFFLTSSVKSYQTVRFRLSNAGRRLYVDKQKADLTYTNMLNLVISSFYVTSNDIVYAGLTYCSPVSSLTTPSTLYLKNFHAQGTYIEPTYEIVPSVSLYTPPTSSTFSTVSGIL
jgi:hypothetical protein